MPKTPLRQGGPAARIAVIPGDGIGKEVTPEAVKVLRAVTSAAGRKIEFVEFDWGADKYLREDVSLAAGAVEMLRDEFDAILFGALGDPRVPTNQHAADILLGLRFKLDLYVNCATGGVIARSPDAASRSYGDAISVWSSFAKTPKGFTSASADSSRRELPTRSPSRKTSIPAKGVERIIRYAFEYARLHELKRVCMSDKSNAMTFAHDLWQRVFKEVRQEYPEIDSRHLYIDTLAMEIVRDPSQFDVIVTCNLFGDIISDLGAQLAGGLGLGAVRQHSSRQDFAL